MRRYSRDRGRVVHYVRGLAASLMGHKVSLAVLLILGVLAYSVIRQDMYSVRHRVRKPGRQTFKLLEQVKSHMDKRIFDRELWKSVSRTGHGMSFFSRKDFSSLGEVNRCSQERRIRIISDTCRRYGLSDTHLERKDYWRLLVDNTNKVIYCSIPKAGCTSMKTLLNSNKQPSTSNRRRRKRAISNITNTTVNQNMTEKLQSYTKILLVRHPFIRLYSAYCDKILEGRLAHHEHFLDISEQYFPGSTKSKKLNLTFSQFAKLVAYEYTSGEFVNRHWMTQYELSRPCDIAYDYVAKLETMDADSQRILSLLRSTQGQIPRLNPHSDGAVEDVLVRVYGQLPADVMRRLLWVYEADFRVFGYAWSEKMGAVCLGAPSSEITGYSGEHCCGQKY